tara:strand:- start:316 stop:498 length:183 start_codon:yes stop_codon:yes gene_type:complete
MVCPRKITYALSVIKTRNKLRVRAILKTDHGYWTTATKPKLFEGGYAINVIEHLEGLTTA